MNLRHISSVYSTSVTAIHDCSYPSNVHAVITKQNRKVAAGYTIIPHALIEKCLRPYAEQLKAAASKGRSGFILATGNTHWDGYQVKRKREPSNVPTFRTVALSTTNIYAGRIANSLGYNDYISTDATACLSAYSAMFVAQMLIESQRLERVLVVAAEDATAHDSIEFFGEYHAAVTLEDEQNGKLPSAFDDRHGGFRIGHGAGFVLLERSGPGPEIDVAVNAEPFGNALGQSESGDGYVTAMRSVELDGVDLIKTHGTGTPTNNQAERSAIESVFGDDFVATSYKPMIGHTMAPNGIIELDILLQDMSRGVVSGIKNRTVDDDQFLSADREMSVRKALCLGSGMGNGFAAMTVTV